MPALILAAALLSMPAFAANVEPLSARQCAVDNRVLAVARDPRDGFQRLDRLPPASLYLTVLRTVDRCPTPAIVRADVTPRR